MRFVLPCTPNAISAQGNPIHTIRLTLKEQFEEHASAFDDIGLKIKYSRPKNEERNYSRTPFSLKASCGSILTINDTFIISINQLTFIFCSEPDFISYRIPFDELENRYVINADGQCI